MSDARGPDGQQLCVLKLAAPGWARPDRRAARAHAAEHYRALIALLRRLVRAAALKWWCCPLRAPDSRPDWSSPTRVLVRELRRCGNFSRRSVISVRPVISDRTWVGFGFSNLMKLLSFRSVKVRSLRVSRHLLPVGATRARPGFARWIRSAGSGTSRDPDRTDDDREMERAICSC